MYNFQMFVLVFFIIKARCVIRQGEFRNNNVRLYREFWNVLFGKASSGILVNLSVLLCVVSSFSSVPF